MKKLYSLLFIMSFMFLAHNVKADDVSVIYQTHIQDIGWQYEVANGSMSGTEGQSKRLEGIKVRLQNQPYSGDIIYQTHIQDIGWQYEVANGNMSGTEGQSKRLEAIKIYLTGEMAENYDIYYRVHVQNFGWLGWASNGSPAGSAGYAYRLEGINIVIVPKGSSAPGTTWNSYFEKQPSITYQTHIQDIGWQGSVPSGYISGTEGQSKRLEALKIDLDNGVIGGNIEYQTHVQDIGWQNYVTNHLVSGTSGQSKRLEAIRIRLSGDIANYYDIYYRVHVENFGWLGWTSNGEPAGSEGYAYRMEAMEIRLIRKGDAAPELDNNAFYIKPKFVWYYENGVKNLYNNISGLLGTNVSKVIDVSEHQGKIYWNHVKNDGVDGVMLRLGYGSTIEDPYFQYNLSEVRRLGIPYGIYLFSYAENATEAESEARFVIDKIHQYGLVPTLGVYYDIEQWHIGDYWPYITADTYDSIITTFANYTRNYGYESWVYTGLNYSKNRLNPGILGYANWIAQYNNRCEYTNFYKMWQFSSTERVAGIKGNVDMNMRFN